MSSLIEFNEAANHLSLNDRAALINHLSEALPSAALGADDEEANHRDAEVDSGEVALLSHDEFLSAVGRR